MKVISLVAAGTFLLSASSIAFGQQSSAPWPAQLDQIAARMGPLPAVIKAPADRDAMPLYGGRTPGKSSTENWARQGDNVLVRNVTRPTLTPVLPDPAKASGAAVVVAPGGGFMALSMESEGFAVARMLASRGIAAFVLKYRLLPTPVDEGEARKFSLQRMMAGASDPNKQPTLQNPDATEDGLAALALVRSSAKNWGIDPARVGMIGFSAGAMTALNTALASDPAVRPAFFGFIYGPQVAVTVPKNAPPMFDAIALDDPLFQSRDFAIIKAWQAANRPVELHAYGKGGHGFGLGRPNTTTTLVGDEFVAWLSMLGFLKK
jgi:acetyl esterase/lipase